MTHTSLMVGVVLFVISGYGKSFCPDVHFLKARAKIRGSFYQSDN